MRSRALSGIFTSGRRPRGFSSTLLKVPNISGVLGNFARTYADCSEISFLLKQ